MAAVRCFAIVRERLIAVKASPEAQLWSLDYSVQRDAVRSDKMNRRKALALLLLFDDSALVSSGPLRS